MIGPHDTWRDNAVGRHPEALANHVVRESKLIRLIQGPAAVGILVPARFFKAVAAANGVDRTEIRLVSWVGWLETSATTCREAAGAADNDGIITAVQIWDNPKLMFYALREEVWLGWMVAYDAESSAPVRHTIPKTKVDGYDPKTFEPIYVHEEELYNEVTIGIKAEPPDSISGVG